MNLPDNYGMGWTRCRKGHRFHMSDGGCDVCIEAATRSREVNMDGLVAVKYEMGDFTFSKKYTKDSILVPEGSFSVPIMEYDNRGNPKLIGLSMYNSVEQAEDSNSYKFASMEEERRVIIAPKT